MRLGSRPAPIVAVAALAAVLVAEGAARLADLAPTRGASDVPLAVTVSDARLGYTLRPDATLTYAGVAVRTNALGLRGEAPSPGTPVQVLALGDELTFGWNVADADAYPARLGEWLHGRCPSCGRVVNAGVPGYTSYQGLMLLRALGPRLRPRVVAIAFHLNDALLDAAPGAALAELDAGGLGHRLDAWLVTSSRIYGWARMRASRPEPGWWTATSRVAPSRYLQTLRALDAETRHLGAALIALDVGFAADLPDPGGPRLRRGRYEDDYHALARRLARERDVAVADFVGPELDATTMYDAVHPNPAGYRRIATLVGETMDARGLLVGSAP